MPSEIVRVMRIAEVCLALLDILQENLEETTTLTNYYGHDIKKKDGKRDGINECEREAQ